MFNIEHRIREHVGTEPMSLPSKKKSVAAKYCRISLYEIEIGCRARQQWSR